MELAPDFDEFVESLTAHGVEFLVVGAYALAFHGSPRFTGDLDILVRPTLDNAARLLTALESFGAGRPRVSGRRCRPRCWRERSFVAWLSDRELEVVLARGTQTVDGPRGHVHDVGITVRTASPEQ